MIGSTPFILGSAFTAYGLGRWKKHPRLEHLGMDEIEGALLTEGIVEGGKQIARRDRPLNPDGTKQAGFSFPSGHAAMTFDAATILQQHLGYKAGIPTYLVATYVAMSRLRRQPAFRERRGVRRGGRHHHRPLGHLARPEFLRVSFGRKGQRRDRLRDEVSHGPASRTLQVTS